MSLQTLDHDSARRLMAEAIAGRLDAERSSELAVHLVACAECKTLYEGLQLAHPALAQLHAGPPPPEAVDLAVHRATTVLRGDADPGAPGRLATELGHGVTLPES